MTPPPPSPTRRPPWLPLVGLALALIASATVLDQLAWHRLVDARVYERDWGRLLRVMGYAPLWVLVGIVVAQHHPLARWRGVVLAAAPLLAGAIAELLKLLLRRERPPMELYGGYVFRPFTVDPWSTRGLGLPSSHVMVAIAAAAVLSCCFPRGRWLWYALAVGCGLTRVAVRAHYLSDVAVALVAGWAVGVIAWRVVERRNAPRADAS
jgi:membrane-associated phospholipid phosphatase